MNSVQNVLLKLEELYEALEQAIKESTGSGGGVGEVLDKVRTEGERNGTNTRIVPRHARVVRLNGQVIAILETGDYREVMRFEL